jgi:hypothetical protein
LNGFEADYKNKIFLVFSRNLNTIIFDGFVKLCKEFGVFDESIKGCGAIKILPAKNRD